MFFRFFWEKIEIYPLDLRFNWSDEVLNPTVLEESSGKVELRINIFG